MLFNSYEFIFLFFPLVLAGFFAIGRRHARAAAGFLGCASLFFYGWWSVEALPLLIGSIAFNYTSGSWLLPEPGRNERARKYLLMVTLAANLTLLAFFKYADFFIDSLNHGLTASGITPLPLLHVVLPIGISFYTFTQIAYVVDCWAGKVRERRFVNYLLFVTYFPHLIAGPVLHHAQMMPQFADPATYRPQGERLARGLAIFVLGLAKKILLADPLGQCADLVFNAAGTGTMPSFASAWLGVLAYTLQIYFDFSGYSDMAIGLSLCLGVQLPLNFDTPYRSTSIIDFWRRWHITLSTFLRDYLYLPLGGNRRGEVRRYVNLMLTMLIGGLWHGAAWTFVLWGGLHGAYLAVNHLWRRWAGESATFSAWVRATTWLITFLCVTLAWVLFRASSIEAAMTLYGSMFGAHGFSGAPLAEWKVPFQKADFYKTFAVAALLCAVPDSVVWARHVPGLASRRTVTVLSAAALLLLFAWCVSRLGRHSAFLYFQF